jgi:hypothetical protein
LFAGFAVIAVLAIHADIGDVSFGGAPMAERKWFTLVPFHAAEGMTMKDAAKTAGKSERTVRNWCTVHGIGRRVADGTWVISKVALQMLLDGDMDSLISYRDHGVRASYEPVAGYFHRFGLGYLLDLGEFAI